MSAGCAFEMANHSFGLHDPFIDLNAAVLAARLLTELLYDFDSLYSIIPDIFHFPHSAVWTHISVAFLFLFPTT